MYHFIQSLREKPVHTRKQIAAVASFVVTFFIFMFWLSGTGFSQGEKVLASAPAQSGSGHQIDQQSGQKVVVRQEKGTLTASVAQAFSGFRVFKTSLSNIFGGHTSYTAPQQEVFEVVTETK